MMSSESHIRLRCAVILLMVGFAFSALAEDRPEIGAKTGQMYPDFVLPTLDGDIKRLSDFRGKRILLFHFASW